MDPNGSAVATWGSPDHLPLAIAVLSVRSSQLGLETTPADAACHGSAVMLTLMILIVIMVMITWRWFDDLMI